MSEIEILQFPPVFLILHRQPKSRGEVSIHPRIAAGDLLTIRRSASRLTERTLPCLHFIVSASPRRSRKRSVEEKYVTPTPIQAQAIPHVLAGRDLLGIAQTGTGKTAAFALPILQRLWRRTASPRARGIAACWCSPRRASWRPDRRELRDLRPAPAASSVAVIIGGVPIRPPGAGARERRRHPGRHAGPPARPHAVSSAVQLDRVEILVLDEADRMLDMGFIHDVRRDRRQAAAERQTLFFSATMPDEIEKLAAQTPARSRARRGDAGRRRPPTASTSASSTSSAAARTRLLAELLRDEAIGPRARLHPHQARRRPRRPAAGRGRHRRPRRSTATSRRTQRERALADFRDGQAARAGRDRHRRARHRRRRHHPRRQLRPARTCRRATSTASAAPRAPARAASRSRSAIMRSARTCATSRS